MVDKSRLDEVQFDDGHSGNFPESLHSCRTSWDVTCNGQDRLASSKRNFSVAATKWKTKVGLRASPRSPSCARWCWIIFILFIVGCPIALATTELRGQVITDLKILDVISSPYLVTGNVVIEREGELRIEPGVELKFVAGVGVTVRGVLRAEGLENRVIRFTRSASSDRPESDLRIPPDVRLVDGPSINEGRLQLFYKGKWRSVCTNSKNWTSSDFEVACRQMGFLGGSFSRWHARNNDSSQLLYETPRCQSDVGSLMSCNWASRQMGSGVCDLHYDIGILCEPQSRQPLQYWSGIRFDSARYNVIFPGATRSTFFSNVVLKMSPSSLRHVEILYAGWNATSNFTSALETYGVAPTIDRVTVKYSAYTGINVTSPEGQVDITNCLISNNRGYGVFVNSTRPGSLVYVLDSTILANGADGIRYHHHDLLLPVFNSEAFDFCTLIDRGTTQAYPLLLNAMQEKYNSPNAKSCQKSFQVEGSSRQVLTLHVGYLESTVPDGGEIEVRDGQYPNSPLLHRFTIGNGTHPQSVTSTGGALWIRFSPAAQSYVVASMEIMARPDKAFDLNVTGTTVKDNNGRGIAIENLRSMLNVIGSQVVGNKYLAGVHVAGGVGDVNLTRTTVSDNLGDGVNVSYAGGRRNLTACNLMRNGGRGFALWLNESSAVRHSPAAQNTVVAYCTVTANGDVGVLIGNYCRSAVVNITFNTVREGLHTGVLVESCWRFLGPDATPPLRLFVSLNTFVENRRPALVVAPAVNLKAIITYNRFLANRAGSLLIRNPPPDAEQEELLERLPSDVVVTENIFEDNSGTYVAAVGLSSASLVQRLSFVRNELRRNKVTEPFGGSLVPRHRVAAVVTVASGNVDLHRNLFENPDSRYEIGAHLTDHYSSINASHCYFGKYLTTEALKVYDRVFDSKDRYDLATVSISPFLLVPDKDETSLISDDRSNLLVVDFRPEGSPGRLGGTVYGRQELPEGTYVVWRDIFVRGQSELVLTRRTTLKFAPSVGMMVQGKLTVRGERGDPDQQVLMTLLDDDSQIPGGRQPVAGDVPVRLVGGRNSGDARDGVLQVRVDERWGTICDYGWNRQSAALACAAMGLALNPDDWRMARGELPAAETYAGTDGLPVLLSNVRCTELDDDLLSCRAEGPNDFEEGTACSADHNVGLRCYRQAWAGVRLGPMADRSEIRSARVERAGVLDARTGAFRPALRMDLNRHLLDDVTVSSNLHAGVGTLFNDMYADATNGRRLVGCTLENNLAHGLLTRTPGLAMDTCVVRGNRGHGVLYNPSLDHSEQRELSHWLDRGKSAYVVVVAPGSSTGAEHSLRRGDSVYVTFDARTPAAGGATVGNLGLTTDPDNVFGVQILSPVHSGTNETVTVIDGGPAEDSANPTWDLKNNELDFPMATSGNRLQLRYERLQRQGHGDVILYITAVERRPVYPPPGPVPTLRLANCDLRQNAGAGLATVHYNHQVGPIEQRRLRIRNESLEVVRCRFTDNRRAAIWVVSPFHEIQDAPLANITYVVNLTDIDANVGGGIVQDSRDLHGSNNLFHWLISDNRFRDNQRGGMELVLPYTSQYRPGRTHTLFFRNNTFANNRNFGVVIDGHYARVEARWNKFIANLCYRGLWQIKGTEKEVLIEENLWERNKCEFIAEFYTDSHTEKFGHVEANFRKNRVSGNVFGTNETVPTVGPGVPRPVAVAASYQPRSYTIGLRGTQKVNVTNNVFSNNTLDYEFLAGIITGSLSSRVNVQSNWWGTIDSREIRSRIFDFDDWNSFAVADFSPYSVTDEIYSSVIREVINISYVDLDNLGGRLYNTTYLRRRGYPYVVRSDLTVMPGATLHIEAGVELQFFPSVGILVLGALRAIGREELPIRMLPFSRDPYRSNQRLYAREALAYAEPLSGGSSSPWNDQPWSGRTLPNGDLPAPDVRLCTEHECGYRRQGFLELYNGTMKQWVPLCDPYFTEHNAEVACRELGYDALNAHFRFGTRWDIDRNFVSRVVHWPEPRQCTGAEDSLVDCPYRFSGYYRPTYPCAHDGDFLFVYCGSRGAAALPPGTAGYWGGVRFASPSFEPLNTLAYDAVNAVVLMDNSALEFVEVTGAGILHNERSPAVLAAIRSPNTFMFVNVTGSASHGVSVIAPTNTLVFYGSRMEDNLGVGVHVGVMYGESRSSLVNSFAPISVVYLPYNVFGMVDVCSSDKVLFLQNRMLLYYKYDQNTADCVKIFTSYGRLRPIGFRLLQFNLLNTTLLSPVADSLTLLDGELYGARPPELIAQISTESGNLQTFFQSVTPSLTVRLHASGGSEMLGFIAEVVTIPTSTLALRDRHHNITNCVVARNTLGGVVYSNVGEIGPIVSVLNSQMKDNGVSLFGNFSTVEAAIRMDVQNTIQIFVQNNLFSGNQGGLKILADSETSASSMRAFISNNLFHRNEKWNSVCVAGRKASPYQTVELFRNAISQNYNPYKDVILLKKVVANVTGNYVVNNTGDHIMTMVAFDQISQPDFQVILYNSFWNNFALRWDQRSTVVLVGAGQRIEENIFMNPYNDFEIMIRNLSRSTMYNTPGAARIDGTNNWWGYNQTWAVSGRIWDGQDENGLVNIVYQPYYIRNDTLVDGKCPPGWRLLGKTCFLYVGGVMEFDQAEAYCESINGSIPYIENDNVYTILAFIARYQVMYDPRIYSVWVRTISTPIRGCSSLRGARAYNTRCDARYPVVCETDPDVYLDPRDWSKYTITYATIGAVAATLFLVLICVLFWLCKSRQRHKEKLERRNSIRSSMRSASSRSLNFGSSAGDVSLKKKMKLLNDAEDDDRHSTPPSVVKMSQVPMKPPTMSNGGSVDSVAKSGAGSRFGSVASSQFNSSVEDNRSYDVFEARNTPVVQQYSDYDEKFETEAAAPPPPLPTLYRPPPPPQQHRQQPQQRPRPTVQPCRPPVVPSPVVPHHSDDDYFDDTVITRTPPTPSSSNGRGFGFNNKCYLETHFSADLPHGSVDSMVDDDDDPVDLKRTLEMAREKAGSSGSRSTPSTSSNEYYKRQLLETEM